VRSIIWTTPGCILTVALRFGSFLGNAADRSSRRTELFGWRALSYRIFGPALRLRHGARMRIRGAPRTSSSARALKEGVMPSRVGGGRRTADLRTLGAWPNAIELTIRSIKQGERRVQYLGNDQREPRAARSKSEITVTARATALKRTGSEHPCQKRVAVSVPCAVLTG
jgi:hypothetical protein